MLHLLRYLKSNVFPREIEMDVLYRVVVYFGHPELPPHPIWQGNRCDFLRLYESEWCDNDNYALEIWDEDDIAEDPDCPDLDIFIPGSWRQVERPLVRPA